MRPVPRSYSVFVRCTVQSDDGAVKWSLGKNMQKNTIAGWLAECPTTGLFTSAARPYGGGIHNRCGHKTCVWGKTNRSLVTQRACVRVRVCIPVAISHHQTCSKHKTSACSDSIVLRDAYNFAFDSSPQPRSHFANRSMLMGSIGGNTSSARVFSYDMFLSLPFPCVLRKPCIFKSP